MQRSVTSDSGETVAFLSVQRTELKKIRFTPNRSNTVVMMRNAIYSRLPAEFVFCFAVALCVSILQK